jgi:hypothetical protein
LIDLSNCFGRKQNIYIFHDFQKNFDFLPLISFGRKIRDENKITGQYVRRIGVSMTLQNDGRVSIASQICCELRPGVNLYRNSFWIGFCDKFEIYNRFVDLSTEIMSQETHIRESILCRKGAVMNSWKRKDDHPINRKFPCEIVWGRIKLQFEFSDWPLAQRPKKTISEVCKSTLLKKPRIKPKIYESSEMINESPALVPVKPS